MVYNCVIIVSFQARLLPGLESQHRELLLDMAVPECVCTKVFLVAVAAVKLRTEVARKRGGFELPEAAVSRMKKGQVVR